MKHLIFIFIVGAIFSCSKDRGKSVIQTSEQINEPSFRADSFSGNVIEEPDIQSKEVSDEVHLDGKLNIIKDSTELKFSDIKLIVDLEEVWNQEDYFGKVHEDSLIIELGLASKITGHTYKISKLDSNVQKVEVLQNYETSLTLMNEGPHIDLIEWKHYYSDWENLQIKDNKFSTIEYPIEDWQKFPEVTKDEIVQAVKAKLNGESIRWVELAQKCEGPNDYPCRVSISRINLKIILTNLNGEKSEKIIIYEMPMGC